MAKTLVGIVYYLDDPDQKVFRIVTPTFDDAELDVPDPQYGAWTVFGVDPARPAVMEKVLLDDPRAQLSGNVGDPPTTNGILADGTHYTLYP